MNTTPFAKDALEVFNGDREATAQFLREQAALAEERDHNSVHDPDPILTKIRARGVLREHDFDVARALAWNDASANYLKRYGHPQSARNAEAVSEYLRTLM